MTKFVTESNENTGECRFDFSQECITWCSPSTKTNLGGRIKPIDEHLWNCCLHGLPLRVFFHISTALQLFRQGTMRNVETILLQQQSGWAVGSSTTYWEVTRTADAMKRPRFARQNSCYAQIEGKTECAYVWDRAKMSSIVYFLTFCDQHYMRYNVYQLFF